jgi:hypothetical protein
VKDWRRPLENLSKKKLRRTIQRGPRCFECSGFRHIRVDCENLKQAKGKTYNVTLSDESEEEEEIPAEDQKFLAFVAPHED